MIKYKYPVLVREIGEGLLIPNNLWVKDNNDNEWFWHENNFVTGMKDGDTEPPYIFITDRYNIIDLYNLELEILDKSRYNKLYSMQQLLDKYSNSTDVVYVRDDKLNDSWEFIPITKSVINANTGENIFDFIDTDELAMTKFEVLWREKCLPKEEIKSLSMEKSLEQIKEVREILDKLEKSIINICNLKEV